VAKWRELRLCPNCPKSSRDGVLLWSFLLKTRFWWVVWMECLYVECIDTQERHVEKTV